MNLGNLLGNLRFVRHNRSVWKTGRKTLGGPEILVEFSSSNPLIGFSYMANVLAEEFQTNIRAFVASPKVLPVLSGPVTRLFIRVGFFLGLIEEARTYRSFGAQSSLLVPVASVEIAQNAAKFSHDFFLDNPDKRALEKFAIENVPIGDLIYDTYLRQNGLPTVGLSDESFKRFFLASVTDFLFWLNYVSVERVSAVIASHAVYALAFPLRVAIAKGIPCFVAGSEAIYRLSNERPYAEGEFLDYPEFFEALTAIEKENVLADANSVLENRFQGRVGPNSDISEISAMSYRREVSERVLSRTANVKVLVALHAFSDSPHWGGDGLFPDYWEWLRHLAEWSKRSPYEWYLKNHPDFVHYGDMPTIRDFLTRFPQLTLLPDSISHHQIIDEGISVVLTVHGTIGFEYAFLGVPVVNASRVNPHVRYPFNYHPQTVAELDMLLSNLHNLKKPDEHDKDLARQYFAVKHHLSKRRLLVEHLDDLPTWNGGLLSASKKIVRRRQQFVEMFDEGRHRVHVEKISAFVKSDRYFLK